MRFTVVLKPDTEDGGFVAQCPAVQGCVSEGDSVEEALANMKEAIAACLESLQENGLPIPQADDTVVVASVDVDPAKLVAA